MTLGDCLKFMRQCWPFPGNRRAVVEGYTELGTRHRHTLADIGLRNHVFADAPAGSDRELAIAEGRRRCALEIMALSGAGHGELWNLLERKPTERGPT